MGIEYKEIIAVDVDNLTKDEHDELKKFLADRNLIYWHERIEVESYAK